MKELLKKIFALLGLEIRRIPKPINDAQDAVEYNLQENCDAFYADPSLVKKYISRTRLESYRLIAQTAFQHLGHRPDMAMADIGCGTGHLLLEASEVLQTKQLLGIEHAESALQIARIILPKAKLLNANLYELSWEESYDLITCISVLEHLEYPEKALNKMLPGLKENGILLIVVPNGRLDQYTGHIHFWSPESFPLFFQQHLPNGYSMQLRERALTQDLLVIVQKSSSGADNK